MAFDEQLAARIRSELNALEGVVEKKMFGGTGFLIHGNMACGVIGSNLIVRVGPDGYAEALARPHTRPFDLTGRAMTGWVYVEPGGVEQAADLRAWIERGVAFAKSLPGKGR